MMEGSYLPNNPSFLQDAWKSLSPIPGFEEAQDLDTPDMEPFANLFACASPYKNMDYSPYNKDAKSVVDSNDVYASMRHTLVHPGTDGQTSLGGQFQTGLFNQGASKSLMEPVPPVPVASQAHVTVGVPVSSVTYPQIQVSGASAGAGHFYGTNDNNPAPVFPAVNLNLSMNMTMGVPTLGDHFVGTATSSVPPSHVSWTVPSAGSYNANGPPAMMSGYGAPVQMPSPPQAGAGTAGTYTFTAEFRPAEPLTLPAIEKEFPSCNASFKSIPGTFYPHPCKAVAVPIETTASSLMFKPKGRSVPTGLAACFPAGPNPETASPPTSGVDGAVLHETESNGVPAAKLNLCRICGKTYARPSTLKTHLRTHSGERPYRCGTCHKSFSQAANLTAHIRTHSGEKPFRCYVCDRRFSQSSSVTTHMRTHSGERPYRCYMCKKSFSDSSTLTKHLRIHSGEKPYQCKLCLLRFSQSGNLNRHMRVHAASI